MELYDIFTNISESFDKNENGAITLHDLVNELFVPWEQVDESQHNLLAIALQTAVGGIPALHVGVSVGGSSPDLPWNDNDKYPRKRTTVKRH